MSRPLRLEFPGALYHLTSRGDRKAPIYLDHTDRAVWLSVLKDVCARYNFVVHGFCEMMNHYHIVLETVDGNLTQGMRQLNGVYSQYFNRQHHLVGHLFQGRYKSILIQRETYLLELARYVVLNPVRAGVVALPEQWPWSSYTCFLGEQVAPAWLDVASTLSKFGAEGGPAIDAYRRFVMAGIGGQSPHLQTRHQFFLGDDDFAATVQQIAQSNNCRAISRTQRRSVAPTLEDYAHQFQNREQAMAHAYHSKAYTLEQIGAHFGVSSKTVSRVVRRYESG